MNTFNPAISLVTIYKGCPCADGLREYLSAFPGLHQKYTPVPLLDMIGKISSNNVLWALWHIEFEDAEEVAEKLNSFLPQKTIDSLYFYPSYKGYGISLRDITPLPVATCVHVAVLALFAAITSDAEGAASTNKP